MKKFEMDEFFSKHKTLLKQTVPGDEYANIRSDVSLANRNHFTEKCFVFGR